MNTFSQEFGRPVLVASSFFLQHFCTSHIYGFEDQKFRNHRYSIRGFGSKNDSEIIFDTSFDKLNENIFQDPMTLKSVRLPEAFQILFSFQ